MYKLLLVEVFFWKKNWKYFFKRVLVFVFSKAILRHCLKFALRMSVCPVVNIKYMGLISG